MTCSKIRAARARCSAIEASSREKNRPPSNGNTTSYGSPGARRHAASPNTNGGCDEVSVHAASAPDKGAAQLASLNSITSLVGCSLVRASAASRWSTTRESAASASWNRESKARAHLKRSGLSCLELPMHTRRFCSPLSQLPSLRGARSGGAAADAAEQSTTRTGESASSSSSSASVSTSVRCGDGGGGIESRRHRTAMACGIHTGCASAGLPTRSVREPGWMTRVFGLGCLLGASWRGYE
jgi:hypothetical protein